MDYSKKTLRITIQEKVDFLQIKEQFHDWTTSKLLSDEFFIEIFPDRDLKTGWIKLHALYQGKSMAPKAVNSLEVNSIVGIINPYLESELDPEHFSNVFGVELFSEADVPIPLLNNFGQEIDVYVNVRVLPITDS